MANVNDALAGAVTITGTAAEDQTLTADTSALTDADGLGTLHYQWQRDSGSGFVDVGSDQATYLLGDADVDAALRVIVNYTDGQGTAESVISGATPAVANVNDAPMGGVTITGTVAEDQTLTANTSALTDADGLGTLHYQWQRDSGAGVVDVGADQATYLLGDADVDAMIRVVVNYTDGQGTAESVSATTPAVANVNDALAGAVVITGTTTEDQTLTANTSALSDADGLGTLHYQWQRNSGAGFVNVGLDQATYLLGDADANAVMRVMVSYTDGQGTAESVTSAATPAVGNIDDAPLADIRNQTRADQRVGPAAGPCQFSDADGDAITQYQLYDAGAAADSGYFWTADVGQRAANTYVTIDAADLGTTWLRGGQVDGGEQMWVRAFDGTTWSEWDPFTLITTSAAPGPNDGPVATIGDQVLQTNDSASVQRLVTVSDPNGDPITLYQFYDAGTAANSGYLSDREWRAARGERVHHCLGCRSWARVELRGGQAPGSDLMWVRASDGVGWGAWDAFTLVTQEGANTAPVVTIDGSECCRSTHGCRCGDRIRNLARRRRRRPRHPVPVLRRGSGRQQRLLLDRRRRQRAPNTYITVDAADLAPWAARRAGSPAANSCGCAASTARTGASGIRSILNHRLRGNLSDAIQAMSGMLTAATPTAAREAQRRTTRRRGRQPRPQCAPGRSLGAGSWAGPQPEGVAASTGSGALEVVHSFCEHRRSSRLTRPTAPYGVPSSPPATARAGRARRRAPACGGH